MGIGIIVTLLKCMKVGYIILVDIAFMIIILKLLSKKPGNLEKLIFDFNRAYRAKDVAMCSRIYRKIYVRYTLLTLSERRKYYPVIEELRKRVSGMRK
jgi:hypothetical protein